MEIIDAAFSATGRAAVSYDYEGDGVKFVICDHFVSLAGEFPSLSISVDAFTHNNGTTANLFNAHGVLPTSPATPPILVTIWIPLRYPYSAPLVYVFPTSSSSTASHPFIQPASGAVTALPYLQDWQHPSSNLGGLARNLADMFSIFPLISSPPIQSKEEIMWQLVARLRRDVADYEASVVEDVEHFGGVQAMLRERRSTIAAAVKELKEERDGLVGALAVKVVDGDELSSWLQTCRGLQAAEDETEWFEGADEMSRGVVESEAADLAIDDLMDALAKALEDDVVSFKDYMKQVRTLAREQFYHRALALKLKRSPCL